LAKWLAAFGRLDVLVKNAGVRASIVTAEELAEEEWHNTFEIDAKGSWLCSRMSIPEMRQVIGGVFLFL